MSEWGNTWKKERLSIVKKNINLEDWEEWEYKKEGPTIEQKDYSDDDSYDPEYRDSLEDIKRSKFSVHLIFIALVLILVIIIAVKLFVWNKGTQSDYDPNNLSTEFDTEALDVIFPLLPSQLEGRESDGVQTILCLGNDTFADDRDSKDSLVSILQDKLSDSLEESVVIHNGSFAGTTVSNEDPYIRDETLHDLFNLYWIINSLCQKDFTFQENALMKVNPDGAYEETVNLLKGLDMDTIDTLVIFYDASDYQLARHVTDPSFEMNTGTYIGAMSSSLKMFKEAYPHVRIILLSPTYLQFVDENGEAQNGDTYDVGNGSFPNYLLHLIDTAQEYDVTILDNYYGSITEDNYKKYLSDEIHLNKKGREVIADRLAAILP